MFIVAANVLLHAVNRDAPEHRPARTWLDAALAGPETISFAWTVLLAFLRVSTHPAVFGQSLAPDEALAVVRSWLAQPTAAVVEPWRTTRPRRRLSAQHGGLARRCGRGV